jgi:hypothetical protein
LYPENRVVWKVWRILSGHRGTKDGPQKLTIREMLDLAEMYDLTDEDFESLVFLEGKMFPVVIREYKKGIENARSQNKDQHRRSKGRH